MTSLDRADPTPLVFEHADLDTIVAFAGCSLDRSPGSNWVQGAGGLPEYICEIARAIHRGGTPVSRAIAIAVSRVKKWAAGLDNVDADTRAKAAKALAQWEALKVKNKAKKAAKGKRRSDHTLAASNTTDGFLSLARTDFNTDTIRAAFDTQSRAARSAWRTSNPGANYDDGPPYLYIKELWTSFLIVNSEGYRGTGKLYKVPYTVDAKQNVTFAEPVEVKTQYVTVPASDAPGAAISDSDLKTMVAASNRADPDALAHIVALAAAKPGTAVQQILDIVAEPKKPNIINRINGS